MISISHTIHIDAPPDLVWRVMVGVERWPEFAPQFARITRIERVPIGLESSARVTPKGFWGAVWTVTEYTDGRSFTWEANMLPGAHLVGGHVVEPDAGGSLVTLSLKATGPTTTLLSPIFGRVFGRNVRQEGEGMKVYCEAKTRAPEVSP